MPDARFDLNAFKPEVAGLAIDIGSVAGSVASIGAAAVLPVDLMPPSGI